MLKSGHFKKSLIILAMPMMASAAFHYWNPADTAAVVPKLLSATGIYQNITALPISAKKLDTNALHFDVNAAPWSDAAHKSRWVMLKNRNAPNGTGSIKYEEQNDYWGYPESTVFIKQFAIDTNGLDTTSRILWETRFLMNRKDTIDEKGTLADHWYGYSYQWRKDQTEADLVDMVHGKDDSLRVWPNGVGAGKTFVMKKWHFPTIYECTGCHRTTIPDTTHGRSVLGFFTAQLNHPHPDFPTINQLEYFFTKKVLTGTKTANWDAPTTPRWRGLDDSAFTADKFTSLDVRARSYIAANCSGCHGRRGIAVSAAMGVSLNYDYHTNVPQMEFRDRNVSYPFGRDTIAPYFYPKNDPANVTHRDSVPIVPALVVPGYPEKSVLLFRQTERRTERNNFDPVRNQMPPLATFEVNDAAVALLTKWIKAMPALGVDTAGMVIGVFHGASAHRDMRGPVIRNGMVIIPADLASSSPVSVRLTGIDGRTSELKAVSRTQFAVPAGLPKGVYILRVGHQSFTRYLF